MSLLTAIMDHVSNTEVQRLDEEGRAVFSQHAKTFLDGLQTLLNAIRLAKVDGLQTLMNAIRLAKVDGLQTLMNSIRLAKAHVPIIGLTVKIQYFGLLYCLCLASIETWIAKCLTTTFTLRGTVLRCQHFSSVARDYLAPHSALTNLMHSFLPHAPPPPSTHTHTHTHTPQRQLLRTQEAWWRRKSNVLTICKDSVGCSPDSLECHQVCNYRSISKINGFTKRGKNWYVRDLRTL